MCFTSLPFNGNRMLRRRRRRAPRKTLGQLIWASPRELLNVFQADEIGCHVITATADILKKLPLVGKDLHKFSQETVQMFRGDAVKSGYSLPTARQGIPLVSRR